jgi:hypothetical protein
VPERHDHDDPRLRHHHHVDDHSLPDCGDDVAPGTVNTVRCRLGILADQIAAANGLGQFRAKLQSTLTQASDRVDEAVSACATGDDKTASRRMKQTGKLLQKMTHRLSGLPARKKLTAGSVPT